MPALGMAQDTGKLIAWLKKEGENITQGEPIMEVETDKATVEIEATASGILGSLLAQEGQEVPVGRTVAWIIEPGETVPEFSPVQEAPAVSTTEATKAATIATPVAQKIAIEHGVDLALVKPEGGRIQKADVLAYLENQRPKVGAARLAPASPKARLLARERDIDITALTGSGPEGAVLAEDILGLEIEAPAPSVQSPGVIWQRMAERVTQSWTTAPHFYLMREVNVAHLVAWREQAKVDTGLRITYTDLLVKLVASALRQHPRINASWQQGQILLHEQINIGIAAAIKEGLIVPIIHQADMLSLSKITERRQALVDLAQTGKLGLEELQGGTFTISNLGMYGVDIFNAILNPPQAAILAVGRIVERVVPVDGQPAVQPMMTVSLSYDHRVVDGARGAQFLETLANFIEQPLRLLN